MPIAGVSHCSACHAVVNIQWTTCAVCSQPIKAVSKPTQDQWVQAWDALAQATTGIEKSDPSFMPVMAALKHCDAAFEQGNWGLFREAAKEVQRLMNGGKG